MDTGRFISLMKEFLIFINPSIVYIIMLMTQTYKDLLREIELSRGSVMYGSVRSGQRSYHCSASQRDLTLLSLPSD